MRIAVLSDVHGNALALEAVLDDMRTMAPDCVFNLGDCLAGPFDPCRSADLQMSLDAITVAGNHERGMLSGDSNVLDALPRSLLSQPQLAWLAVLPATARYDGILACHGSPIGGDTDNLLDAFSGDHTVLADDRDIYAKLGEAEGLDLVLCGHTHVPRAAQIGKILVLNPGSVGLPAFRLREPRHLIMETGTPHARYALATRHRGTWSFEMCSVAYDWNEAAEQAVAHGCHEVASWTRTGRA